MSWRDVRLFSRKQCAHEGGGNASERRCCYLEPGVVQDLLDVQPPPRVRDQDLPNQILGCAVVNTVSGTAPRQVARRGTAGGKARASHGTHSQCMPCIGCAMGAHDGMWSVEEIGVGGGDWCRWSADVARSLTSFSDVDPFAVREAKVGMEHQL